MSAVADDHAVESLSNAALVTLLMRLDAEERHISKLRSVLHTKIESLQRGSESVSGAGAELEAAVSKEREISARRLALHKQIDDLRLERDRRLSSLRKPSLTVVS